MVVTGANRGLGKELARRLYLQGASIIALCRNRRAGEVAVSKIIADALGEAYHGYTAHVVQLDLASLESVKSCVEEIKQITTKIDILINNAGDHRIRPTAIKLFWTFYSILHKSGLFERNPKAKTKDGYNANFGVNYLGHFLLTQMLLPLLVASKSEALFSSTFKPKVINLSCFSHGDYPMDLDKMGSLDPNLEVDPW